MSFQVCIKTEKSLQQLATEIRELFALPQFKEQTFSDESYCQFEMLGLLILLHYIDEDDRDPEVTRYSYSFDMQAAFTEHELDTDEMEYRLQPYYAQLLTSHLGLDTAYHEKQKIGPHWQMRYHFLRKNPQWNEKILYGEQGWQAAVLATTPSAWRNMHPVF